jgi:hypothetical protein
MEKYPVDAEVDSGRLNRRFGGRVVLELLERKRMGVDVGFACRHVTGWAAVDDIDGLGLAGLDDNLRRTCKSTTHWYKHMLFVRLASVRAPALDRLTHVPLAICDKLLRVGCRDLVSDSLVDNICDG